MSDLSKDKQELEILRADKSRLSKENENLWFWISVLLESRLSKELTLSMIKNGIGFRKYPDGTVYIGDLKEGKRNGDGIQREPSGNIYIGEFKKDKYNGHGKIHFSKEYMNKIEGSSLGYGRVLEGEFKDGEPNGHCIDRDSMGIRFEGEYINGRRKD